MIELRPVSPTRTPPKHPQSILRPLRYDERIAKRKIKVIIRIRKEELFLHEGSKRKIAQKTSRKGIMEEIIATANGFLIISYDLTAS